MEKPKNGISEDLLQLTYSQIQSLDNNATSGQTAEYYENAMISNAAVFRNRLFGRVGNIFEEYQVNITVHKHELSSSCTCGHGREVCQHAVALLYSWVNEGQNFFDIGKAIMEISQLDKEALVDILTNLLQSHPALFEVLLAKNSPDWDEIDLDPLL
ncbi:hypothetical protein JW935_23985 [candidate division KSB1 bacterium]|nr:hypothetical protein [candidate division KSB1 bacterium]